MMHQGHRNFKEFCIAIIEQDSASTAGNRQRSDPRYRRKRKYSGRNNCFASFLQCCLLLIFHVHCIRITVAFSCFETKTNVPNRLFSQNWAIDVASTTSSNRRPLLHLHCSTSSSASSNTPPPSKKEDESAYVSQTSIQSSNEQKSHTQKYSWTPQTLQLAIPALVAMLADPLLSMVDTVYTGRVGSVELAALGACTSIFHLAFNAFRGFTAATTTLVATELSRDDKSGGGDDDDDGDDYGTNSPSAQKVVAISLWFASGVGMGVSTLLFFAGRQALALVGVPTSSALYIPGKAYLYARLWAAPAVLFLGVAEGAFRGYRNTLVPLKASAVAAFMNLILDPLLMFGRVGWGVRGAGAATALSQVAAVGVYVHQLEKFRMLPPKQRKTKTQSVDNGVSTTKIIRTILAVNAAMLLKQGSLLLGWFAATARATRLGTHHVAAHQVGLSVWLVFALILDGTAVAAQVLMSRAYALRDRPQMVSLSSYMVRAALVQGLVSMLLIDGMDLGVPQLFTRDPLIQRHVHGILPHLAWQQILVSLTLVAEGLAVGANQFRILAVGTAVSTVLAVWKINQQTSVEGIWAIGIVSLFVGRLVTAALACANALRKLKEEKPSSNIATVSV